MFLSVLRLFICLTMAAPSCAIGYAHGFNFNSYRYLVVCEPTGPPHASAFANPARDIINTQESQARRMALIIVSAARDAEFHGGPDEVDDALSKEIRRVAFNTRCLETDNYMDLIGLDGDIKMVWYDQFPDLQDIYARIDAMPMRQREMREAAEE